jgi:hypothetical protein
MQRWAHAPRAPKRRRAGFPALLRFFRFLAAAQAREERLGSTPPRGTSGAFALRAGGAEWPLTSGD